MGREEIQNIIKTVDVVPSEAVVVAGVFHEFTAAI